jgi:MFS family permease
MSIDALVQFRRLHLISGHASRARLGCWNASGAARETAGARAKMLTHPTPVAQPIERGADMPSTTASTSDHHPTLWYSEMSADEKSTFWACFAGWMLDGMDVQMFSFAIPAIIAAFAITNADAGLIGTATLVSSAIGGWIAGALADRIGRVRTLQFTVAWFAVFTFLCGFAQSYGQLFAFRALMGLGFGGEWAAAAVLMGEAVRAEHRGKAVGALQTGFPIGWGIAAVLATLFFSAFSQQAAWRVLFWVGLSPALLVFFVRRYVKEPPVFAQTQRNLLAAGKKPDFLEIFSPVMIKTTILACLLTTGAQGGFYAITTWLPTYLRTERKLTVLGSGGYLAVIIIGSITGGWVSAWLSDRIGRRLNFILYAVCSIVTVIGYTQIPIDDGMMLFLGFPLGFFAQGVFSGMGPVLTELYPTRMRGSGQGFTYNFGRGIAAMNPLLVGMLSAVMPLGQSIGIFAVIAYGLLTGAALLLPETKGRILTTEAA